MTQPSRASSGPATWISMRNECPCTRAHLFPAGTFGRRCALSTVKLLNMSTRGPSDSVVSLRVALAKHVATTRLAVGTDAGLATLHFMVADALVDEVTPLIARQVLLIRLAVARAVFVV